MKRKKFKRPYIRETKLYFHFFQALYFKDQNTKKIVDSFLDLRIRLQPLLSQANRFPRSGILPHFLASKEGDRVQKSLSELKTSLSGLLDDFSELQRNLLLKNPETANFAGSKRARETSDWKGILSTQIEYIMNFLKQM